MKIYKKISFVIAIMFVVNMAAFQHSKSILKKVAKETKKAFDVADFQMENITITDEVNGLLSNRITTNQLNKLKSDTVTIGYVYIAQALSKTDKFDYLILLDFNLIIKKVKVLMYREDYGGEIGSKRWLKQFIGKSTADHLKYKKDIMAISGATISARSMTIAVNNFLKNITILKENKIL